MKRTVDESLIEEYHQLLQYYSPSCLVSDAMEEPRVLSSTIKPTMKVKLVGTAMTIKFNPDQLGACYDILGTAGYGDVIVVDAGGCTEISVWGGIMSGLCKQQGVLAAIVDGAIRDVDEIRDMGFPVFYKAIVPRSNRNYFIKKRFKIQINIPVNCGGIQINPGDIIVADEIGVVVVAPEEAPAILMRAKRIARKEGELSKKIKEGINYKVLLDEMAEFLNELYNP